jgi:hypothetical protein
MTFEEIKKQLKDVNPNLLELYLVASGWIRDGELGNLASIWHRPERHFNDAEVLLPQSQNLKDFNDRIADAVLAITAFERRSLFEIAKDIAGYSADFISVRVLHSDVTEGSIPLNDGVLLNIRARDLVASSAMSVLSKCKHFSGQRPQEAREFLETLRLGQTEVGSYVVNVIAPIKPVQSDQQEISMTSMTRMVTANLSLGLDALSKAIDKYAEGDDLRVFDAAVADGASANMCDALLGLSGEQRARGFEITITPSPTEAFKYEPRRFFFDVEKVGFIAAASTYYKDDYVLPDRTISGVIKRLDRPAADDNGTITVEATIAGHEKFITIELEPLDYLDAVTAHKAKTVVECHGDIHVKARTAKLLNPSRFRVIRSGDLF